MIQLIKNNYKVLLGFVSIILIACAIWMVDVRRQHSEDAVKDYADSCNRVRDAIDWDLNLRLSQLKAQDSIRGLNKIQVIKTKNEIKNLSHSALQLAIDTIRPKR